MNRVIFAFCALLLLLQPLQAFNQVDDPVKSLSSKLILGNIFARNLTPETVIALRNQRDEDIQQLPVHFLPGFTEQLQKIIQSHGVVLTDNIGRKFELEISPQDIELLERFMTFVGNREIKVVDLKRLLTPNKLLN